jgi:DNA polymerase III epsilon subunit family exonuclease
MSTERGEWEWVADASLPEVAACGPDRVLGIELPSRCDPETLAAPEDAARLRRAAREAAERHLERHRRRVRRGRGPRGEWAERSLADLAVLAVDLETTGGGHADAIVEVGCVQLDGDRWGREFSSLVRPACAVGRGAFAVHGIATEALAGAPALAEILPAVEALLAGRVLLAHNARFDVGFLRRAWRSTGRGAFRPVVIDTVALAHALLGGRCGLGAATRRLGIDAPHPHRALPDARLAALLWRALAEVLMEAGATRLGDVPGAAGAVTVPPPARLDAQAMAACLAQAAHDGSTLALTTRPEPDGGLPLHLSVRVLRRLGAQWLGIDLERRTPVVLDPARVDLRAVPPA